MTLFATTVGIAAADVDAPGALARRAAEDAVALEVDGGVLPRAAAQDDSARAGARDREPAQGHVARAVEVDGVAGLAAVPCAAQPDAADGRARVGLDDDAVRLRRGVLPSHDELLDVLARQDAYGLPGLDRVDRRLDRPVTRHLAVTETRRIDPENRTARLRARRTDGTERVGGHELHEQQHHQQARNRPVRAGARQTLERRVMRA